MADDTLDRLIDARAQTALAIADGDLLDCVFTRAPARGQGAFRETFLPALEPLSAALEGTPLREQFKRWRDAINHATVELTDLVVPEVDDEARREELVATGSSGHFAAELARVPLDPTTLLSDIWAEPHVSVTVEGAGVLRLELPLRQHVLDLRRREVAPDIAAALLPGVTAGLWATLFDPDSGAALAHCHLLEEGPVLAGRVAVPPRPYEIVIGTRPLVWVGAGPLAVEALRAAPLLDGAVAAPLAHVGGAFANDDSRRKTLTGLAAALEQRAGAGALPTGVLDSPASEFLSLCHAARQRLADVLLSEALVPVMDDAARAATLSDVERLDDLLL